MNEKIGKEYLVPNCW